VLGQSLDAEAGVVDPSSNVCYDLMNLIGQRMLYRLPKQAKQPPKGRQKNAAVRLEVQDAFKFLAKLKPGSVDLIVSSPPYCMGKEYDTSISINDFIADHKKLAPLLVRALKDGGSLCWQVGHHVHNGVVIPLDALVYQIFSKQKALFLRNRIVWTFGHGVHASRRFSGRHETILWFTKGDEYEFNLDAVRVPQKYPGKRHYKGPKKGQWSGNPLGKNPSDVWEIPNVKSRHVEKTDHPCQFPVALVQRLVRALTKPRGLVADPFMGSGSSAVAAALEHRRFEGCDIDETYVAIAKNRIAQLGRGAQMIRPLDRPIYVPQVSHAVAQLPIRFQRKRERRHG
jgi:adenine-specific DNA-methyltransferase